MYRIILVFIMLLFSCENENECIYQVDYNFVETRTMLRQNNIVEWMYNELPQDTYVEISDVLTGEIIYTSNEHSGIYSLPNNLSNLLYIDLEITNSSGFCNKEREVLILDKMSNPSIGVMGNASTSIDCGYTFGLFGGGGIGRTVSVERNYFKIINTRLYHNDNLILYQNPNQSPNQSSSMTPEIEVPYSIGNNTVRYEYNWEYDGGNGNITIGTNFSEKHFIITIQ